MLSHSIVLAIVKWAVYGLILFGLWGSIDFGLWWFQEPKIHSLPLFLLLSFSLWFIIVRSIGYWFLLIFTRVPQTKVIPLGVTVDVMTTAAPGEPVEMIQACLDALIAITYPHKTYLLDDSHSPGLESFCINRGIHYITRTEKMHAKCGNVNHGLHHSSGEFVLIVDPDHIVEPHYLNEVLGYFDDPLVGFVQTTQAYCNQHTGFVANGGAEQTYLFYGPVMTAMGALGTNLVIGTNCTFRRRALESIGLYKPGLAEDLHTSMALHSQGWKSVYVPKILARGLTPEDLSSFFHQQLKWSRGVLELLGQNFWTYAKGWSWRQRLLYLLSMSYYFEALAFAVNIILPVYYLWTHQFPAEMSTSDFILHIGPWAVTNVMLFFYAQQWLCSPQEKGFMIRGLLLQFLSFHIHILGIGYALIGKKIAYLPTAKTPSHIFPIKLLLPQVSVIGLTIFNFVFLLLSGDQPSYTGMSLFSIINGVILGIALSYAWYSHLRLSERVQSGFRFFIQPKWKHYVFTLNGHLRVLPLRITQLTLLFFV